MSLQNELGLERVKPLSRSRKWLDRFIPTTAPVRAAIIKKLDDEQIEKVHYWDLRAQRVLEAFEIVAYFGIAMDAFDLHEMDYWKEVARRRFPEEIQWSTRTNDYIRRPEIVERLRLLEDKHPWVKLEPGKADFMMCWHDFDWDVKKELPDYYRPIQHSREKQIAMEYKHSE